MVMSRVESEFRSLLFLVLFLGFEMLCPLPCDALPVFIRGRPRGGMLGSPLPWNDDSLSSWTLPPNMWLTQRLDHFHASDTRTWKQVIQMKVSIQTASHINTRLAVASVCRVRVRVS